MAVTGELSGADKVALSKALEAAGGTFRGKVWLLNELDVDTLRASNVATPAGPVILATVIRAVPAGLWGRDSEGKIRFVPNPDFHIDIEDDVDEDNETDEDDDVSALADPTPRGKLENLGL